MQNYKYILFDLDGTLTDSGPGIVNGFAYAVSKMGGVVEDKNQFKKFVGPPLRDSFERVLGYSGEDVQKAISLYREYYNGMGGNLENEVYPGIGELLKKLKDSGRILVVATSKNAHGTEVVLEHFGLKKYFDFVSTANDTDRQSKEDVIRYALEHLEITDTRSVVMIGDREYDCRAAKEIGIDSIGVLYGYGDEKELIDAGATYLAKSAKDIEELLLVEKTVGLDIKELEILGDNRFETFTKTRDGSRAIVVKDGMILLTHENKSGWWLVPGGGLEEGETFEECCEREVEEETGYIVKVIKPFLHLYEYYEEYRYGGYYYICEVVGQGKMNPTEHELQRGIEPKWVPLQEAIDIFSKHQSYADTCEEQRGSYLREYTALSEYVKQKLN